MKTATEVKLKALQKLLDELAEDLRKASEKSLYARVAISEVLKWDEVEERSP